MAARRPRAADGSWRLVRARRSPVLGLTMHDRALQVPEEAFVAAWNGAGSLDEAAERVKELAGGKNVPRWAVLARATAPAEGGQVDQGVAARCGGVTGAPGVDPGCGSAAGQYYRRRGGSAPRINPASSAVTK